jgi:hypothetical protein
MKYGNMELCEGISVKYNVTNARSPKIGFSSRFAGDN